MADLPNHEPVHVTAEERPHPALQMLARAFIALARMRQAEERRHVAAESSLDASADGSIDGDEEVRYD